jgi:hypothetical protein
MSKVIYFLLTFFLLLLFLELALRFSGKLRTYPENNFGTYQSAYKDDKEIHLRTWNKNDKINSIQTEFKFKYVTNNYGFLNFHNYKTTNRDSSIVFLGDSFVFGVGASQDSSVCFYLEKKFAFNFINAGIPGSDPFYEKVILDSIFHPLGYKKYLFMVNFSDLYDYICRGGSERFLPNSEIHYREAPSIEPYYKSSFLIRGLTHLVLQRDFSLQSKKITQELKTQAIDDFVQLFNSLPKDIDFVILIQPYAAQYKKDDKINIEKLNYEYLDSLEAKLKANNIKTINLDPKLKKLLNSDNYLDYSWKLDGHYNAKGYALLGEIIAEELTLNYPEFINAKE